MAYFEKESFISMLESKAKMTIMPGVANGFYSAIKMLEKLPSADVAEIIHAKWEICSDGYYPYCSHCKSEPENGVRSKYCPECGARMNGGAK